MKNKEQEFWLINLSTDVDVSVGDLRIKVKKGQRINLLSKHYNFTLDQLIKSSTEGSIFKKKHLLAISYIKPQPIWPKQVIEKAKPMLLRPLRNPVIDISPKHYDELEVTEYTDEQFAAEHAEFEEEIIE